MTPDAASVWTAVFLSFSGLLLHGVYLWRDALADHLRSEILLLEKELCAEPAHVPPPAGISRLARLMANSRQSASDITYTRLVLAKMLLAPNSGPRQSLPSELEEIKDPVLRHRALAIFEKWERAIVARMTIGSPMLWPRLCAKALGITSIPALPSAALLEFTFPDTAGKREGLA